MNLRVQSRTLYRAKSFTDKMSGGNPAGVVIPGDDMTDEEMIILAREMNNISETVYICKGSEERSYRLRYFTSECEVDLCGHATIAAIYALVWSGQLTGQDEMKNLFIETRTGILSAGMKFRNGLPEFAVMEQHEPIVKKGPPKSLAAEILGIPEEAFSTEVPPLFGYTGLWACFVQLKDRSWLGKINTDRSRIFELAPENPDLTGVYPYAFIDKSTTQGRFIVTPGYGIVEDPVTGTACGALGGCLYSGNSYPEDQIFIMRQGFEMGQGGTVRVSKNRNGHISIGGKAIPVFQGNLLSLPE